MTDTNQLEIAIGFITDCYSVQPLRTRRIIIKSRLFESANAQIHNKYVLIASFKLLRAFIDKDNEDIF